jgi:hypothetical protein
VTARLVECTFIAIGIVGMLALSSLRQDPPPGTTAAVGQGIFAVYEWTFRPGPGVFAGVGNGLILGWLMSRSGLVPPRLAVFGLVGGPLVSGVGVLVIVGVVRPRARSRCWWPRSSSGSWGSGSISSSRATGPRRRHWRGPGGPTRLARLPLASDEGTSPRQPDRPGGTYPGADLPGRPAGLSSWVRSSQPWSSWLLPRAAARRPGH